MITLGSRLKIVRVHSRSSQEKFRKELGVSQFTLSNYETGKRFPDSRFLLKLKQITNVDLNWLIGGEITAENFCPHILEDEEKSDFFYWFARQPLVRHFAFVGLYELKIKYPKLFIKKNEK